MDRLIDNPWLLRITALALAVLMFFSVRPNGTGNPIDSTTSGMKDVVLQDVPVELRYDDSNFVVTGVPKTVNVKITGPIGIVLTTQTSGDVKVIVNVKDKPSGEHVVKFVPEGFSDKLEVQVEPKNVRVMVEERITKDVKVEPEINKNQIANGQYIKGMTTEPKVVTVSGAKSAIESISYVKATVPTDKKEDKTFEREATVKIFDRDLNILNVDVDPKMVKVKVDIGEYSREVPVVVTHVGKVEDGYEVKSVSSKTKHVVIYGAKADIDSIHQIKAEASVTGLKKSSTVTAKIVKPTGVSKTSIESVDARVEIGKEGEEVANSTDEEKQSKVFNNINVHLSGFDTTKYTHSFVTPETGRVDVEAEGTKSAIDKLSASDLNVYVDARNLSAGKHVLPIQVDGPEGIVTKSSLRSVTIDLKEQAS